jgi:molybdate transport system substrate-binding protein
VSWSKRVRWTASIAALCLAVSSAFAVACGDDEAEETPAATASSATTTTAVTSTATGEPTATAPNVLDGGDASEQAASTIEVGAAADLRTVMTELTPTLEDTCDTTITWVFGSSGQLKTQIEAGASFGLYFSADAAYPEELDEEGLVAPNGLAHYGVGRIVIATRPGIEPVESLEDLGRDGLESIAIANPAHAPYGRAAEQALKSAGVYDTIRGRLVFGENIRQTTDYVEKGDADAAIVALALVINGTPASYTLIDASLHLPILQAGAVVKGSGAEKTARCLLQFVLDREGQAALARYGFEPAGR